MSEDRCLKRAPLRPKTVSVFQNSTTLKFIRQRCAQSLQVSTGKSAFSPQENAATLWERWKITLLSLTLGRPLLILSDLRALPLLCRFAVKLPSWFAERASKYKFVLLHLLSRPHSGSLGRKKNKKKQEKMLTRLVSDRCVSLSATHTWHVSVQTNGLAAFANCS